MSKVDGVVDVVGPQQGNPEVTWTVESGGRRPLRAHRPAGVGSDGRQLAREQSRPTCGWPDRTIPVRVRLPDSFRFDPNRLAEHADSHRRRQAPPRVGGGDAWSAPTARANCCGRTSGRWRWSAGVSKGATSAARSLKSARRLDTLKLPIGYTYEIGGQYQAQGQAFRELLMVFALAVAAGVHDSRQPVSRVGAGDPDPAGSAVVARRRAAAAVDDGHRPEHFVGDGTHPARRPRRQERDHAARLLREAARRRRAVRDGDRACRPNSSQTDPDDDLLHAVRASAAGARARRGRRAAEAARARRDRRPGAVDAR